MDVAIEYALNMNGPHVLIKTPFLKNMNVSDHVMAKYNIPFNPNRNCTLKIGEKTITVRRSRDISLGLPRMDTVVITTGETPPSDGFQVRTVLVSVDCVY